MPGATDIEALETALFVEALYRQFGADFRSFEPVRLRETVDAFRAGLGMDSISGLQSRVLRDLALARQAISFIGESSSSFFTAPTSFIALRCAVLPLLRSAAWPAIWIAECSDPAFVIQFAIMLEEEGLLARTQLYVTNANADFLAAVQELKIARGAIAEHEELHVKGGGQLPLLGYCSEDFEGMSLQPRLREQIVCSQHDLTGDASFNEFHLVVCQRPIAHLNPLLQKRVIQLFSESLCNFGIMQIQPGALTAGSNISRHFSCILGEQGIYKRIPREIEDGGVAPPMHRLERREAGRPR